MARARMWMYIVAGLYAAAALCVYIMTGRFMARLAAETPRSCGVDSCAYDSIALLGVLVAVIAVTVHLLAWVLIRNVAGRSRAAATIAGTAFLLVPGCGLVLAIVHIHRGGLVILAGGYCGLILGCGIRALTSLWTG